MILSKYFDYKFSIYKYVFKSKKDDIKNFNTQGSFHDL